MAAKEEQTSTADVVTTHTCVGASSSEQNCKPNNCNSSTTMRSNNINIPPPLKFIDININERLPRPTSLSPSLSNLSSIAINDELPTQSDINNQNKDLATQATQLIHWAISSKHKYYNKEIHNVDNTGLATSSSAYNPLTATKEQQIFHQKQLYAHTQFQSLMQLLLNKSNTPLLHYTLNALVSANSGRYLDLVVSNIASNSQLHAQLIHLLMIFNPFCPPQVTTTTVPGVLGKNGREKLGKASVMNVGIEKLRELDMVRKERRRRNELLLKREEREAVIKDVEESKVCPTIKSELDRCNSPEPTSQSQESILRAKSYSPHRSRNNSTTKKKSIKLSESSLQHKENIKYITPTIPYYNYSIANVYIHLLVTLVGNNSLLSVSAVRSLWKLLVDFGMEWKGWWMEYKEIEKGRVDRERRRKERENRLKEEEMKQEEGEPADKKIKIEQQGEQGKKIKIEAASTPTTAQKQVQKEEDKPQSEIDKSTPGMSGLSIDFIRNAFAFSKYHREGYDDYEFGDDYGEHKYTYQASDLVMREEEIYHDRMANGRVRRLLLALVNIFRLCPRAKSDLQREMQSNFPHHLTTPPILYSWYIHMCLQIVHIVPTFEGPTLTLFIDKALDMDIEIKVNNKGLVMLDSTPRNDNSGEDGLPPHSGVKQGKGEASPSPMTPSLSKKRSFHQISNESLVDITPKSNKDLMLENETEQILEISERLDILMVALYQHIIKVTTFDAESLSSAITAVINARRLYRHLDGVFDKKVRTTDRSKFVQFIFLVLFGRENDALEVVGRLMAKREDEQYEQEQQQQLQQEQQRRQRSNSKDMVQTMKEIAMEPDMIPSAPINVTDPLYRGFSAKLIDLVFNPSYAGDVPRQTVVCYLASFVSRATYVCPETVCECLAALLRWAEVYIEAQPASVLNASTPSKADVRRVSSSMSLGGSSKQSEIHALFYTACQAAFYIMCFRGAEALSYYRKACQHKDDPETFYADPDSVDISAGRWKFLCGHTLQPLKYCLESVRLEFLHLAEDLDVFHETTRDDPAGNEDAKREETKKFLETLRTTSSSSKGNQQPKKSIATPKRRRSTIISTAATQEKKRLDGGVGGLGRGSNPLNSFFPFDPYLLQKSYTHVHPYYRNWEDCILTMEDDKAEENHEEEAVEYDEDAESGGSDLDEEEEEDAEDDSDDDDEEDDDEDSKQSTKPSPHLLDEPNLSMEIRRSRAMSTGSQASW